MKKLVLGSIVLIFFAFAITIFEMSCKKDSHAQTTLTKDQILVQKTWKVDKLHHVIAGAYTSYTAGGANTTGINYANLRFTFNANGTGTTVDQAGTNFTTTWQLSADKRSLTITVNHTVPETFTWEMVEIVGNYLHASVNLTIGGNSNNLETFRLIQIP
jgi:hypothetical protein